jgi:threonine dehydrogenase-like Zn-dependent dehydrogenase
VSEINPFRVKLGQELGLEVVNPLETDLVSLVEERTNGAGVDVAFEVSGSAGGAAAMSQLVRTRGRIIVVAIFSEAPQVDLFRFFWRELELRGARVYEPEDFEQAIQLAADGALPLERLISAKSPLSDLQSAFEQIEASPNLLKVLIDTRQA